MFSLQVATNGPKKDIHYWREQIKKMEVEDMLRDMKENRELDAIHAAMMSSTWAASRAPTTLEPIVSTTITLRIELTTSSSQTTR